MNEAVDFSESFSVRCPRCECRFQPAVRLTSYFAKCPDCSEPVRVPAAAEVEDDRNRASESEGETYRIALPTDWPEFQSQSEDSIPSVDHIEGSEAEPTTAGSGSRKSSGEGESHEEAGSAKPGVICPACGASFDPPISDRPQVVLCPECLEDVSVPASKMPVSESEEPVANEEKVFETDKLEDSARGDSIPLVSDGGPRFLTSAENIAPAKNPRRGVKLEKPLDEVLAEIRQVEKDPPPKWTFFSGLAGFLIRPEIVMRWAFASLGFCVVGWLAGMCAYFYASFPIALPFFALPFFWIALMTLCYTAANSKSILLDTASGNHTVESWPEPVMKEQAVDVVYFGFLLIVTQVFSFFLTRVLGLLIGESWLIAPVLCFLLYPVVILSSMEANTAFVPLTMPILKSFKTVTSAWAIFYGLAGGLMLVWLVPLYWSFDQAGVVLFISMILIGPLAAGWCYLSARLLGRLAWRASLEFSDDEDDAGNAKTGKAKKKKRPRPEKPKVSEFSGELQAAP